MDDAYAEFLGLRRERVSERGRFRGLWNGGGVEGGLKRYIPSWDCEAPGPLVAMFGASSMCALSERIG